METTVGRPDFPNIGVPIIKARSGGSPCAPIGSIVLINTRGPTEVDGWLVCDGREFDPEEYPELVSIFTMKRATARQRTLRDRLLRRSGKPVMAYGTNRVPDLMGRLL